MPRDHAKFAEAMKRGSSIKNALLESGASEHVARRGRAGISKGDLEAWHALGMKTAQLGSKLTPDFTRQFIRGKAYEQAIKGEETASMLKILGQDRDVNHFQAESTVGIFQINLPQPTSNDPPVLASVEIVPPKLLGE